MTLPWVDDMRHNIQRTNSLDDPVSVRWRHLPYFAVDTDSSRLSSDVTNHTGYRTMPPNNTYGVIIKIRLSLE